MNNPNRDAALSLAAMGFRVFRCVNDPNSEFHKAPIKGEHFREMPLRLTWQVGVLWDGAYRDALPGLPCQENDICAIDCDRKNGKDGVSEFYSLCAAHSIDLSSACIVETPNNGLHFLYRSQTPFVGEVGKLAPGVDIRSHGNYIIAPGAVCADGRSYRLVHGDLRSIPELPVALARLMRPKLDSRPIKFLFRLL